MELKDTLAQVVGSISKDFNVVSTVTGLIGGFIAGQLGGWDKLLTTLLGLVIVDFITGLLKGWKLKTLDTEVAFVGIIKKVLIFIVVAVSVMVMNVLGDAIPLREIVIVFYIVNEGMSFLENTSEFIEMPPAMQKAFKQMRDRSEVLENNIDNGETDK